MLTPEAVMEPVDNVEEANDDEGDEGDEGDSDSEFDRQMNEITHKITTKCEYLAELTNGCIDDPSTLGNFLHESSLVFTDLCNIYNEYVCYGVAHDQNTHQTMETTETTETMENTANLENPELPPSHLDYCPDLHCAIAGCHDQVHFQ